jgi:hypothetical protein
MAREIHNYGTPARWVSGAALLLVPVLALVLFGSDCFALNRDAGLPDGNAFAPQARVAARPAAKSAAGDEVIEVQLSAWENTANRTSLRR